MTISNTKLNSSSIAAACIAIVGLTAYYRHQQKKHSAGSKDKSNNSMSSRSNTALKALASTSNGIVTPPLPDIIKSLLTNAHLAYLSTCDASTPNNISSHLSLMRFTYLPDEEVIIMSTNKHTRKFHLLKNQASVALLVHDFGAVGDCGSYSITLNGDCAIVGEDDDTIDAERYREAHLKHNPDYPQFIIGDDIAILCVRVTSASVCNIHDQVQKWDINQGSELFQ